MADKRTEKMAQFYEQCQAKGYTDMADETQSLKAKVIAADLGLNYSRIEALYEKARGCHETVEKEREAERLRQEEESRKQEELERKRAVNGAHRLTISFLREEQSDRTDIYVYRRPDGSLYHTVGSSGSRAEGCPAIRLKSGNATLYSVEPSKTIYTSVTVGGVTTGGFSETRPGLSMQKTNSGKGMLTFGEGEKEIQQILLPSSVLYAYRRDSRVRKYGKSGTIKVFQDTAMAETFSYAARGGAGSGDVMLMLNARQLEKEERCLPMSVCREILGLVQDILAGNDPPSDQQIFQKARELSGSEQSRELKEALEQLESIEDTKDIPAGEFAALRQQIREKYDETLQREKEAAVLAKEASRKAARKTLAFALPAALLVAAVLLFFFVLRPNGRYRQASELYEAGQFEEAAAAFEALGGWKDSEEQALTARQEHAFRTAAELFGQGRYEEAAAAFEALGDFKGSKTRAETAKQEAAYQNALALLERGDYDGAIAAFGALGSFKDCPERLQEARTGRNETAYQAALRLYEEGRYEEAAAAFEALAALPAEKSVSAGGKPNAESAAPTEEGKTVSYKDSAERALAARYGQAAELEQTSGREAEAALAFGRLGTYRDARERSMALWSQVARRTVLSAGTFHTVGLREDGTVAAAGSNSSFECSVKKWTDIVDLAAGDRYTVGLRSDGVPLFTGSGGGVTMDKWQNVVDVAAGKYHIIALQTDGTVLTVGTLVKGEKEIEKWTDVIAVAAGDYHSVGLKADGTVVAAGSNESGQCEVGDWTDIVAVAAGGVHTVGLRADGTVVAAGSNASGQCEVGDWTDIVAVDAGEVHTVGLRADGTVVAAGGNGNGRCEVGGWTDIAAVSAGVSCTVGLRTDGTVVVAGSHTGMSDFDGWTGMKIPGKHAEK